MKESVVERKGYARENSSVLQNLRVILQERKYVVKLLIMISL